MLFSTPALIMLLAIGLLIIILIALVIIKMSLRNLRITQQASTEAIAKDILVLQDYLKIASQQGEQINRFFVEQSKENAEQRIRFNEHNLQSLKLIQESLHNGMNEVRAQVNSTLNYFSEDFGKRVDKLTQEVHIRLQEINGHVKQQLTEGFEKTTATFTDVIKRLAIIDEAQKKITELSTNVVSLQEILQDKRSRGAFGEIQLNSLIRNVLPENHFALQHTLSNGKRVDCILFLPQPSGNITIDAKFPLENYRLLMLHKKNEQDTKQFEQQFRIDIRKHIQDVAQKYIVPGETADGAILFIPAEAIFAEIHANFPDLVEFAHKQQVWLVSPTTLMAILTTARAVLKDAATRKQVHVIQEHLNMLSKDFGRFQKRMDNLATHVRQVSEDVNDVHKSSQKISSRFNKIEKVELKTENAEIGLRIED